MRKWSQGMMLPGGPRGQHVNSPLQIEELLWPFNCLFGGSWREGASLLFVKEGGGFGEPCPLKKTNKHKNRDSITLSKGMEE